MAAIVGRPAISFRIHGTTWYRKTGDQLGRRRGGTWPMLYVDAIVLRPLLLVAPRAKKGYARNKPAVTGSCCTTESEFGAEVGERVFARVVHPVFIYEPLAGTRGAPAARGQGHAQGK